MVPRRIIFLDFDGVLSKVTEPYQSEPYQSEWRMEYMDRLNQVIDRTGAEVVVCSSWRKGKSFEYLQQVLNERGFKGKVIGKTPDLEGIGPSMGRGHEIAFWIYQHWPVWSFVIFDDEIDIRHLQERLVNIENSQGIQDHHIGNAVELLEMEWKW